MQRDSESIEHLAAIAESVGKAFANANGPLNPFYCDLPRMVRELVAERDGHKATARRLENANRAAASLLDGEPRRLAERATELETQLAGRCEQVESLQQTLDECVVAAGSLGLSWKELPAKIGELRTIGEQGTALLRRVVIAGCAGSWTEEEHDCWACDLKDFLNGHSSMFGVGHENCHHAGGGNDYRKKGGE